MLERIFTWWNGTTMGAAFTLFRRGAELVGKDEQGNRYFEEQKGSGANGVKRRWVVYHGVADASRVPADWHGWLHHTFDEPPTKEPLARQAWERDHMPNMTGTPLAHHPAGSLYRVGEDAKVQQEYEAWTPQGS